MPVQRFRISGERGFLRATLLCVAVGWLGDRLTADASDRFTISAIGAYALLFMLARVAGALAARLLQRPAVSLPIATRLVIAATLALGLVEAFGDPVFGDIDPDYGFGALWIFAAPIALLVLMPNLHRWAKPGVGWGRRLVAVVMLPIVAMVLVERSDVWSAFYYTDHAEGTEVDAALAERADAALDYDPEDLLAMQDDLVDAQLATLAPQRPGQVDLYVVAMAGDGAEDVFRNEVDLATATFDERFDTTGRSLSLINHVDTLPRVPLATRRNLLRTLEGVGRIIEPAEDIVLVFMTSHGSEAHDWLVQLGDYTLTQITPDDLLEAYDNAGIRWRVAIVSACYSGGYVNALASPTSFVITSARADRTSFGCGADAELTYFGRAFLGEALKQSTDLSAAFELARRRIEQRERADGFESSEPQISVGASIATQLARWRGERSNVINR